MTTSPHVSARPAEGAQQLASGRWLMLIILLGGQFMALLDVTIVNVAMPTMRPGPPCNWWWPATR